MKIFLSHATRDKPLVREIRKHLPEHIRSWIDEKQILIGDNLESSIREAIEKASDLVIIFLSRDSVRSDWVKRELAWALQREATLGQTFVLPILFDQEAWDLLEPKEFRLRKYILCSDFSEAGVAHTAKMLNDELFAHLSRKLDDPVSAKSHIKLVDMPIQAQSEQLCAIGKGLLLECSAIEPKLNLPYGTDFIGQDIFFPLIDLKLKNSGNDVAYLTKLEIVVEEVRVNPVPILEFYMSSTQQRELLLQVKNCGWGPARDVCIEHLHEDKLRKHLNLAQKEYFWRGTVEAEQVVDLVIPRSSILTPSKDPFSCPPGFITYSDFNGKEYAFQFRYCPYPFEDYVIIMDEKGFEVRHHDYARAREPSARYNIILPIEPRKYRKTFSISHEIAPKETERFQVVVASEKSADFQIVVRIWYDKDQGIVSDKVSLSVVNPNHLWYYSYLKPSWAARAAETPGIQHQAEVLVRTIFPESGESFNEVFLRGDDIIEVKDDTKPSRVEERNNKSSAIALNNIAWMLISENLDIAEGIRKAQKSLALTPDDPYLMDTLALGHYKQGAYDEAVKYWEMAQQSGLDDEELREWLSKARTARKRKNSSSGQQLDS